MSAATRSFGTAAVSPSAWRPAALTLFAVGWGANQFVPLLLVYRRVLGLGDPQLTAVFYSLAYLGLALPYLIALVAPVLGYGGALLAAAGLAALTLALVGTQARRHRTPAERKGAFQ